MSPNCGVFSGMRCLKMLFFGLPSHKFLATPLHSWNCFNKGRFVCVGIFVVLGFFCLQCFDAVGWVSGRVYGLQKTMSGGALAWLSVWREVQTCIWSSWCHCHSLSLASEKSRLVLLFWYRFTCSPRQRAVKRCVCVCRIFCTFHVLFSRLVYPVSCICELGVLWLNTYQVFMPLPIDCFRAVHPSVRVCMWVEVFPLLDAVGFSV